MENQNWNYVIGDIHGCYDELLELEEKIGLHAEYNSVNPFIISVGDLIDRGPLSNLVVEHFIKGVNNGTHLAILGNHEQMLLETLNNFVPENFDPETCPFPSWFSTYRSNFESGRGMSKYLPWQDYIITSKSIWMSQGGFSTLVSYGCDPYDTLTWKLPEDVILFLINMPVFWENEKAVVTHALPFADDLKTSIFLLNKIKNKEPLNTEEIALLKRSVYSLLWNRVPPKYSPHETKKHISGHTPFPNVKRLTKISCSQIDTSCVFGGRLTALCVETNTLISAKAKRNYLF